MLPFLAALTLSWFVASTTLHLFPYSPHAIDPPPAVHTVYLCCLPAKDQSRHPQTLPWSRPVKLQAITPADVAPHVQAQENRKPQKRKQKRYARASW